MLISKKNTVLKYFDKKIMASLISILNHYTKSFPIFTQYVHISEFYTIDMQSTIRF